MASKVKGSRKTGARILTQKFDPRSQLIGGAPSLGGQKLTRGRLVHAETGKVLKFQHNPIGISVSHVAAMHATSVDGWTSEDEQESGIAGGVLTEGIGGITVPLIFDRTYETWDSAYKNTLVGKYGVYADVLAFYEFVGITPEKRGLSAELWTTVEVWQSMFPETAMVPTDAYLHIGNRLKYFGRVQGLAVSYTHFTGQMVPNRCVIELTMKLLPATATKSKKDAYKPKNDKVKKAFDPKKGLR